MVVGCRKVDVDGAGMVVQKYDIFFRYSLGLFSMRMRNFMAYNSKQERAIVGMYTILIIIKLYFMDNVHATRCSQAGGRYVYV